MSGLFMRILVSQECQYFIRKRFDLGRSRGPPYSPVGGQCRQRRLTGGRPSGDGGPCAYSGMPNSFRISFASFARDVRGSSSLDHEPRLEAVVDILMRSITWRMPTAAQRSSGEGITGTSPKSSHE